MSQNDSDYVAEAAEALDAPGEIWLFRDKILYDPANPVNTSGITFSELRQ